MEAKSNIKPHLIFTQTQNHDCSAREQIQDPISVLVRPSATRTIRFFGKEICQNLPRPGVKSLLRDCKNFITKKIHKYFRNGWYSEKIIASNHRSDLAVDSIIFIRYCNSTTTDGCNLEEKHFTVPHLRGINVQH